ncbi:MAG: hypothetical protein WBB69_03445 [Anaerolineales bacterium]
MRKFRGQEVPETKDTGKFVQQVLSGKRPSGLSIRMEGFVEVYGELLNSASGTGRSNPFYVGASSGPCWVICAQCEVEFDEPTIAALGKNSAMAAFGMLPVTKCQECGSAYAVIVSV